MKNEVYDKTNGNCWWCGLKLSLDYTKPELLMNVDHLIPVFRGGGNYLANLVPACRSCNSSKGTKMPWDFMTYMSLKQTGAHIFNETQKQWLRENGFVIPMGDYSPYADQFSVEEA